MFIRKMKVLGYTFFQYICEISLNNDNLCPKMKRPTDGYVFNK